MPAAKTTKGAVIASVTAGLGVDPSRAKPMRWPKAMAPMANQ